MNFQIQIVKNQHALPITRTYMSEAEEALRTADGLASPRSPLRIVKE
jgi:cyclopropane-fatty-acyl-phospholipid synthase